MGQGNEVDQNPQDAGLMQPRRQNFSVAGAQLQHQNLDWAPSKNYAFLPYFYRWNFLLHCNWHW